jgi:hypothetical protein
VHARFGISALAVLALVAVSGCEAGVRDGGQAAPSSPAATPSATGGTTADCHVGSFEVTEIASRRGIPSAIGDLTVASSGGGFRLELTADGAWRLTASGDKPLTVQAGGISAQGTAKGEVRGRYARSGDKLAFTRESASGSVTVQASGQSRTVSMDDFAAALAPDGATTVTCGANEVRLTSEAVVLTLARTGATASPAAGAGLLTITGAVRPHDEECGGRNVLVQTTGAPVRLRGDCPRVEISGRSNTVDIDRVDELVVTGSANTVTWTSGLTRPEPAVQPGSGNTVKRK